MPAELCSGHMNRWSVIEFLIASSVEKRCLTHAVRNSRLSYVSFPVKVREQMPRCVSSCAPRSSYEAPSQYRTTLECGLLGAWWVCVTRIQMYLAQNRFVLYSGILSLRNLEHTQLDRLK